ncbi:hypothetical protein ABZP36_023522 [Zizania latifolia]
MGDGPTPTPDHHTSSIVQPPPLHIVSGSRLRRFLPSFLLLHQAHAQHSSQAPAGPFSSTADRAVNPAAAGAGCEPRTEPSI